MQTAQTLEQYKAELRDSLDNEFLRKTLDNFAVAYRTGRENAFKGIDLPGLIAEIAAAKDDSVARLDELYAEFKKNAEAIGIHVHMARTALEANEIIARIAEENNCKTIVKSKSMTAEETLLNHHLEDKGLHVTETDLGEWIIQLRHEGPSHMVMPAIHLSRYQVADLFSQVTKKDQDSDIQKLVKVARRELRVKYAEADMGISGGNFAIADSATIGLVTNEGNARLVTTLPRVHVALLGLDKLTPTLHDALRVLRALPRNATGQQITSYATWITGPNECGACEDTKKIMHVVFLDNGRRALAKDPDFKQVLRCVRCGACANVCPVYRMVGGHKYGHIYIGAIGLILTYFFHGREKAKHLVQNCINCQSCKAICPAGIDLPRLIKEIHARIQNEEGHPMQGQLLGMMMKNRKLFHGLLRAANWAQRPFVGKGQTGGRFIRHLPMVFAKDQDFRALPAVAETPFRDLWEKGLKQEINPKPGQHASMKVALFSGCVHDFVYPEQFVAAAKAMAGKNAQIDYPMQQSCCGLPLQMMGELPAARDVALQNLLAMDPAEYDYIVTSCASCASHLKHNYPKLLEDRPDLAFKATQFAEKVIDFSSFVHDVLKVAPKTGAGKKVTYHAPCHLCRGLDVREAPRALISASGNEYVPCAEEEVCCGFGGTYGMKFAEISNTLLQKKLDNIVASGASVIVTDCPGCVMQIRGGMEKRQGQKVEVKHIAELLG